MANSRILRQATAYHIPADEALQSTKQKHNDQSRHQLLTDTFLHPEINKRYEKNHTNHSADKAMDILPEINLFKIR